MLHYLNTKTIFYRYNVIFIPNSPPGTQAPCGLELCVFFPRNSNGEGYKWYSTYFLSEGKNEQNSCSPPVTSHPTPVELQITQLFLISRERSKACLFPPPGTCPKAQHREGWSQCCRFYFYRTCHAT